uniref:MBL fold metallo-hydrolase n=1 Tax=Streptomyces sp. NBC_00119 TaxID=2975659 RepID=A0AAU1U5S5_9ACTN
MGIASAVAVGDRYYLVDAGSGVGGRLHDSGLGEPGVLDTLAAVFLTHLHSDHVVDLNNLLSFGAFNGLESSGRSVPVWGPGNRGSLPPLYGQPPAPEPVAPDNPTPGTREMLELMARTYATDFNDRAFDNRKPLPSQLVEGRDVPMPQ